MNKSISLCRACREPVLQNKIICVSCEKKNIETLKMEKYYHTHLENRPPDPEVADVEIERSSLQDDFIKVRVAFPSEFKQIANLALTVWHKPPSDPNFIYNRLKQKNSIAIVAIIKNQIVGVTTATFKGRKAFSEETVILQLWRNYGIATKLLLHMRDALRTQRITSIYGESSIKNLASLLFFNNIGFKSKAIKVGVPGFETNEIVYITKWDIT
jgi:L-amino acid N-acyltransferase YncA